MPPAPASPTIPPTRRRVFLAITLAVPWLLLALAEGGLRVAGVGEAHPLFVPYAAAPGWRMTNPTFARRFFAGSPFVPTPHIDFFRAQKSPGTFRIFFQGESSAAGFPYGHGGAPSRILQQRLAAAFPDRTVEVVNTAFTAVNSYALLDQADEIITERPDAVLIYTGHNEYYGALGAASARGVGGSRVLARAYLGLQRLRVAQVVARAVQGTSGRDTPPGDAPSGDAPSGDAPGAPRTVMELMAGDQRVPLGSASYERGIAQFRANLADLLARYRAHRIPVFVGTVASNERDQAPFVSAPGPGGAAAAWARARALETAGDTAAARAAYRAAKERDELRFRAPEAINAVIREEAARHGATLVESQQAIERASPGGVPGASLMLEHLHPNVEGYFLISEAFADALRHRALPAPWPDAAGVPAARSLARAAVPITAIDSLSALYRVDRLTAGWPFRPRAAARMALADTLTPRTPAEQLALAYVRGELPWAVATDRLRETSVARGDTAEALRAVRALALEFPYTPQPYLEATALLEAGGRDADALQYARLALRRRETPELLQRVGLLALRVGDVASAGDALERAAALAPGDRTLRGQLAAARMMPRLLARRARAPGDTAVLYDLATAYALTGQYAQARRALDALRTVAPEHERAAALAAWLSSQ